MANRETPSEPLVVIMGSTGTGKSDLAVELARRFNGEVINADAMQMYRGLPIITNKISAHEQRGVPHHLLGTIGLDQPTWVVHHFKAEAGRVIREIRGRGKLPIVVGGSQYYTDGLLFENHLVESLLQGDETTPDDDTTREYPILDGPTEAILEKLKEVDPAIANRWHPKDHRKISRSLEIYLTTGRRASDIYAEQQEKKQSQPVHAATGPWQALLLWVYSKPDVLEERLFKRVDKMVDNGLLEETREIHDHFQHKLRGGDLINRSKGIWQSIGCKEMEPYLHGVDQNLDTAELAKLKKEGLDSMKFATRRYAKYQIRWIRTKSLPWIKEAGAIDRLFLLDSSDTARWDEHVARPATHLASLFLDGNQLPSPLETSQTARDVLSALLDSSNAAQSTPCHKTCEICHTTLLTEREWEGHLKGNRHRRVARRKQKKALVPVRASQDVGEDDHHPIPAIGEIQLQNNG